MNQLLLKLRKYHALLAVIFWLPALLLFSSGALMVIKYKLSWFAPPVVEHYKIESLADLPSYIQSAKTIRPESVTDYRDVFRINIYPTGKAVLLANDHTEVTMNANTAAVLAHRTDNSRTLRDIHSGQFFTGYYTYLIVVPTGLALILISISGFTLFFHHYKTKLKKGLSFRKSRNWNDFSRNWHRRAALLVALPVIIIFTTGNLIVLRHYIPFFQLQEVNRKPITNDSLSPEAVITAGQQVAKLELRNRYDFNKISFYPNSGYGEIKARNGWAAKIDLHDGSVIRVYRRYIDTVFALHKGVFFGEFVAHFIFFPVSAVLIFIAFTGLRMVRWKNLWP